MGNSCSSKWKSWTELNNEYEDSRKLMSSFRRKLKDNSHKKTSEELVHQELAGSMERELISMRKVLKSRALYDRNSLSEEDLLLPCLTDRQRQIARLRQKHSNQQVAKILKLDRSVTFMIFKQALNNISKYKKKAKEGKIQPLTPQQEKILKLYNKGMLPSKIAAELNTSKDNVKKQLRKIRDKVETKAHNKDLRKSANSPKKEIKSRSSHGHNFSNKDNLLLPCVTDEQRQIARIIEKYSDSQGAEILKYDSSFSLRIINQGLSHKEKYKTQSKKGEKSFLTSQQGKVAKLHNEGMSTPKIGAEVNITKGITNKQLKDERNRRGLKSYNKDLLDNSALLSKERTRSYSSCDCSSLRHTVLTPQQKIILKRYNEGILLSRIAVELNISKNRVKKELKRIRKKGGTRFV